MKIRLPPDIRCIVCEQAMTFFLVCDNCWMPFHEKTCGRVLKQWEGRNVVRQHTCGRCHPLGQ